MILLKMVSLVTQHGVVYLLKLTERVHQKQLLKLIKYLQEEELEQKTLQLLHHNISIMPTLQKLMLNVQQIM